MLSRDVMIAIIVTSQVRLLGMGSCTTEAQASVYPHFGLAVPQDPYLATPEALSRRARPKDLFRMFLLQNLWSHSGMFGAACSNVMTDTLTLLAPIRNFWVFLFPRDFLRFYGFQN